MRIKALHAKIKKESIAVQIKNYDRCMQRLRIMIAGSVHLTSPAWELGLTWETLTNAERHGGTGTEAAVERSAGSPAVLLCVRGLRASVRAACACGCSDSDR